LIRGATVDTLVDVGHFPWLERPEVVLRWLDRRLPEIM